MMFAGFKQFEITDNQNKISFPALLMYPTNVPSKHIKLGPFSVAAYPEAPIKQGTFPLIIISHGGGGNYLGYLTIAQYLAEHGYIVASLEHYKNNRKDNDLGNTKENLENRPRHVNLTIEAIYSDPFFKDHVDKENIAIIGHSLGGYTALAVAGGKPWTRDKEAVLVTSHPGVKAIILLAPATSFFSPKGSLDNVTIPIYLVVAEKDDITPTNHSEIVSSGIPDKSKLLFEEVKNAGHFSFLSPFPKSLTHRKIIPSQDPDGFDREAFHHSLNKKILQFLSTVF
jgi:predicted dienelactone hydrolase